MLPEILKPVAHRKVRAVAVTERFVGPLVDIAMKGKKVWTATEWSQALHEIDCCDLTVAEFAEQKSLYFANQSVL